MKTTPGTGWSLNREAFDELLAWLNPDREQAGRKYEAIRDRLIRIFIHRGCPPAEELADKTINKVARKVHDLKGYYVGDPALYFCGVARNVYAEYIREVEFTVISEVLPAPPPEEPDDESESQHNCLDKCLQKMPPKDRDLLLEYYREERGAKIEHHKEMARRLGITVNALRIMICRLRTSFKKCMQRCLESKVA